MTHDTTAGRRRYFPQTMTAPLLQFQDVSFQWPDAKSPVIHGLTWELLPGSAWILDAPSGHGKTTFLKLSAGLLTPTAGTLRRSTKAIGFAFQDQRLFPWMTPRENLRVVMRHPDDAWIEQLLARVGLAEKATQPTESLSGGEAQRINLIRALVNAPDLLFLDEPFNGLDEKNAQTCATLIQEWLQDAPNRALIFATHTPDFLTFSNLKKLHFS